MAKKLIEPSTMMGPLPAVMVSCGNTAGGTQNIITIAWTGIINSNPPRAYISVRPGRASYPIIKESGEFVINLVPEKLAYAMDYCGCVSKKKEEKFGVKEKYTLTPEPCEHVSCPAIAESPVQLECKVFDVIPLGTHDMFLADIVGVRVDESIITEDGRVAMERLGLVSLIHGSYYASPKTRIGRMGYAVMKPSTKKKITAQYRAKQQARRQGRKDIDKA